MGAEPPEVVVIDGDGVAEPLPPDRPPRASGDGARRWGVVLIGALLVFGLGFAAGRSNGYDTGYDAALADASTGHDSAPGAAPTTGMTSSSGPAATGETADTAGSSASSTVGGVTETSASPEASGGMPVQRATDLCGRTIPVNSVTRVGALPAGVPLSFVAGPGARMFDSATETTTASLFDWASGSQEYVSQLSRGGDRLFATIDSCADQGTTRFVEILYQAGGFGARSIAAPVPKGAKVAGLVMGGNTPWAALYRSAGDGSGQVQSALLALDGSARVVELPAGFSPEVGYQGLVVGTLYPVSRTPTPQASGSILQVFDVGTGSIVRQLDSYVVRHVIGDGYLLWEPQCAGPCEIHRYDVASGNDTVVGTAPDVAGEALAYWTALSPDGRRIAMVAPRGDVTGSASSGYQITDGFSVQVFDVATGAVSDGGGIEMPWPSANVAFSPDSGWLLVAVPTRSGGSVLAYDADMSGPYLVATLSESVGGAVPLAMVPSP